MTWPWCRLWNIHLCECKASEQTNWRRFIKVPNKRQEVRWREVKEMWETYGSQGGEHRHTASPGGCLHHHQVRYAHKLSLVNSTCNVTRSVDTHWILGWAEINQDSQEDRFLDLSRLLKCRLPHPTFNSPQLPPPKPPWKQPGLSSPSQPSYSLPYSHTCSLPLLTSQHWQNAAQNSCCLLQRQNYPLLPSCAHTFCSRPYSPLLNSNLKLQGNLFTHLLLSNLRIFFYQKTRSKRLSS